MNQLGFLRWLLLFAMILKEILYFVWILPTWWLAHSQAYEKLVQTCAGASAGANIEPFYWKKKGGVRGLIDKLKNAGKRDRTMFKSEFGAIKDNITGKDKEKKKKKDKDKKGGITGLSNAFNKKKDELKTKIGDIVNKDKDKKKGGALSRLKDKLTGKDKKNKDKNKNAGVVIAPPILVASGATATNGTSLTPSLTTPRSTAAPVVPVVPPRPVVPKVAAASVVPPPPPPLSQSTVQCAVFPRVLHPMNAPRTLMVVEIVTKLAFCLVAKALSGYWRMRYAYVNSLRYYEFVVGGMTLLSLGIWRFITRSHEEIRMHVPGTHPGAAASYYQKWIAPWTEFFYIIILWVFWSVDIFPA